MLNIINTSINCVTLPSLVHIYLLLIDHMHMLLFLNMSYCPRSSHTVFIEVMWTINVKMDSNFML